jgi:hypothetical protein
MSTKVYRLSPTFCNDHWSRDCGATDKITKEGKYCVYVELDEIGYQDMITDADLYSDPTHFDPPSDFRALAQSARRVLAVLRKEGPPDPPAPDTSELAKHAERKYIRFGWCTPGLEADHANCRREVYQHELRQLMVCKCECHGTSDAS